MADLEVIRIPEDPDVPKTVARKVFRAEPGKALVIAWSPSRWKAAYEATGRKGTKPRVLETDHARWDPPERYAFADRLTAWLSRHPEVELLVVSDDFVILPAGMPGGHLFRGPGYCPICKIWHNEESKGC